MRTNIYLLWRYAGQVLGHERTNDQSTQSMGGFEQTHDLRGKTAHYICVTNDRTISRADAIRFCDAIQTGKFCLISCDLDRINNSPEWYAKQELKRANRGNKR